MGMKIAGKVLLVAVLAAAAGWVVWNRVGPASLSKTFAANQAAPDFALKDQDGKALQLSSLRGEKVLLVFYKGYY